MPKDDEMYGLVCKERFDKMEGLQEETLQLLKGKDLDPGLVDEVRGLKKAYKRLVGGGIFIAAAITVQIVRSVGEWISGIIK